MGSLIKISDVYLHSNHLLAVALYLRDTKETDIIISVLERETKSEIIQKCYKVKQISNSEMRKHDSPHEGFCSQSQTLYSPRRKAKFNVA